MKVFFSIFGALALAAITVVACKSGDRQSNDTSRTVSQALSNAKAEAAKHPDGVNRITVTDLKDLIARGAVVVVDVRGQSSYDVGHIAGSIMISGAEIADHLKELPKDKLIVTYCS